MIGTKGSKMLELTARYADQWNGWGFWFDNDPAKLADLCDTVDAACHAAGRDPDTLLRTATLLVDMPGYGHDPGRGRVSGSLEEIAAVIRATRDQGIHHIQVLLDPNTVESISAFAPVLDMVEQH
jgi:alkanesulfonate monooxygenase SsuD/methylene tetrahydromethanopterin reductase-like flavin-dependent oxidoreductase (luciferase family)